MSSKGIVASSSTVYCLNNLRKTPSSVFAKFCFNASIVQSAPVKGLTVGVKHYSGGWRGCFRTISKGYKLNQALKRFVNEVKWLFCVFFFLFNVCLGFIMMTPQLFINYKLKSVAHLPWRMMTYKALNTFIDDLFAFVIKMPTLYRIGCFRDGKCF